MFLDEKGRLFGKVSIIDVGIILVIIIAMGVGVFKFTSGNFLAGDADEKELIIEFYSEEAPDFAVNSVDIGDDLTDYERGSVFGKVVSIEKDKSVSIGMNSDGQFVRSSRPGYVSSRIVVEGKGLLAAKGGVTIDNFDYMIGRTVIIRIGDTVFVARVYDYKIKGE
jgi:hypothetical protein